LYTWKRVAGLLVAENAIGHFARKAQQDIELSKISQQAWRLPPGKINLLLTGALHRSLAANGRLGH
jgi:hypothetical protein